MLPALGVACRSVSARGGRSRDEMIAAVLRALYLAIEGTQFRRIALVISRIDRQKARLDLLQPESRHAGCRGTPPADTSIDRAN